MFSILMLKNSGQCGCEPTKTYFMFNVKQDTEDIIFMFPHFRIAATV